MDTNKIKKAIETIIEIAEEDIYGAIKKAESIFEKWEYRSVMSKPTRLPIERFAIFEKGRTAIILNYSENIRTIEIKKTTSRKEYWAYMNAARS